MGAIPGEALFSDLFSLSEGPTAHDVLSGTDVAVPKIHIFVAAFECDSYSSANTNRTDGPGSLAGLRVIWAMTENEEKNAFANLRGMGLPQ